MKLAIVCCFLAVLVSVGCRKKRQVPVETSASEAAAATGATPANGSQGSAQSHQAAPTLRGVNSDLPISKALAGNDPQAHLRVLNELVMVWDQSQGKPLVSPDDFVKAGMLSKLPIAPSGMKFTYNPNKRLVELTPVR